MLLSKGTVSGDPGCLNISDEFKKNLVDVNEETSQTGGMRLFLGETDYGNNQ